MAGGTQVKKSRLASIQQLRTYKSKPGTLAGFGWKLFTYRIFYQGGHPIWVPVTVSKGDKSVGDEMNVPPTPNIYCWAGQAV